MPQYWFIVEALLALYAHLKDSRKPFTRDNLKAWSEKFQHRPTGVQQALDHLERCGMVRREPRAPDAAPFKRGIVRYTLTAEGAAAASGAAQAHHHALQSAAASRRNVARPRAAGTFAARLWALFRMRRTITAPEAAATLVDAGADVGKATNTASQYLRRWADCQPGAIQISKQLAARGAHRFVLVKDLGPVAPIATPRKKAQGGAAA